jgi:predicted aspartyl protease
MARWSLPVFALLAVAPRGFAAEPPTIEEVKANARITAGFDAFQKLPHGLTLSGSAEVFGMPGTFRCRLLPDGRYARVMTATADARYQRTIRYDGVVQAAFWWTEQAPPQTTEHSVGFDGKRRWGRNFAGPVVRLDLEEADRDRFLFGVLCQRWLADDGGFTLAVEPALTTGRRVCLTLAHPDAGVTARLYVNRQTWLPEGLTLPASNGGRAFAFADYREVAGVAVPDRVTIDGETQSFTAEAIAAGAEEAADSFAPPRDGGGVAYDPDAPPGLTVKVLDGGLLLVRPRVNGKAVSWFLLDTGNGAATAVTPAVADRLGLPLFGGVTLHGFGGSAGSRFRAADRLTLGPVTLHRPVLAELPQAVADALGDVAGYEIGGVVGWDVFARAVVEVDYEAGRVAVHDPAGYKPPAGVAWERVLFNSRRPCVSATFEGKHRGLFMFDTGFQGGVILNHPAVEAWGLLRGRETAPRQGFGVGGVHEVRVGPATAFRAFGRERDQVKAEFAAGPGGGVDDPYTAGTFGLPALGPGTVVFDYPNRRIGFVPRPE